MSSRDCDVAAVARALNSSRLVRRPAVLLLFATACDLSLLHGESSDEATLIIHLDAGDAPAFARVDLYRWRLPAIVDDPDPVITPAMIAGTAQPTAKSGITIGNGRLHAYEGPPTLSTTVVTTWSALGARSELEDFGLRVVALDAFDRVIGGAFVRPHFGDNYEGDVSATLLSTVRPELWGPNGATGPCLRELNVTQTLYFVSFDDTDCDGVQDDVDCRPRVYCDPANTTDAGRAACTCGA